LRIGIDYTPAYEQSGGIGRYVRELIAALARLDSKNDYRLFVAGAGTLPSPPGANFTWAPARWSPATFARLWQRARLPVPVETWAGPVTVYHATDFVLPPVRRGTRTVLTVHDLSFARTPEATAPALKRYLDAVVPRSVRRADHVLADSQATREDLIALYGTPPEKITVLYSGVNPSYRPIREVAVLEAVRARYSIGAGRFVLSVGAPHPRKNFERLIAGLEEAARRSALDDVPLVIAGGRTLPPSTKRVKYLGFVEESDLPVLYSAAVCLAFPSLYEGFGLPVLEAMACGTPVITSNTSSLVEVAGDAALLVDPLSIDSIAAALIRVLNDAPTRAGMIERGLRHASRFTWDRAAAQLLDTYQALENRWRPAITPLQSPDG